MADPASFFSLPFLLWNPWSFFVSKIAVYFDCKNMKCDCMRIHQWCSGSIHFRANQSKLVTANYYLYEQRSFYWKIWDKFVFFFNTSFIKLLWFKRICFGNDPPIVTFCGCLSQYTQGLVNAHFIVVVCSQQPVQHWSVASGPMAAQQCIIRTKVSQQQCSHFLSL